MTLIATGDNLRNKSLMGLQAMSREEAEREALYQQMVQQKAAQRSQLAGTGLGIGASYAVNNPENLTALGQKLGILGTPAPKLGGDAVLSGGKLLVNASPVSEVGTSATQALNMASNPASVGAISSPLGTAGTVTQGVSGAVGGVSGGTAGATATTSGALASGGGVATGAANAGAATATSSAGTLATLGSIAAPLAIGVGAFYLLNKLFD